MVCQKMFLVGIECNWLRWLLCIKTHPQQRNAIGHRGNYDLATVLEADESAVEKGSALGVSSNPLPPCSRSSFEASRHGLM